ncbi:hypothetical protein P3G55_19355 [Leptospira sp. 96542]|nr:hypothetical protein [Leptospira sp. 96542]
MRPYLFSLATLFLISCNNIQLLSTQDILDLLESDGSTYNTSSSSSSQSSSSSEQNSGSQDLDFYGLTDSPTGTNTTGATGTTVGNPLGY